MRSTKPARSATSASHKGDKLPKVINYPVVRHQVSTREESETWFVHKSLREDLGNSIFHFLLALSEALAHEDRLDLGRQKQP